MDQGLSIGFELGSSSLVYFKFLGRRGEESLHLLCELKEDEDENKSKKVYIVGEDNRVKEIDSGEDATSGCEPTILSLYVPSLVYM